MAATAGKAMGVTSAKEKQPLHESLSVHGKCTVRSAFNVIGEPVVWKRPDGVMENGLRSSSLRAACWANDDAGVDADAVRQALLTEHPTESKFQLRTYVASVRLKEDFRCSWPFSELFLRQQLDQGTLPALPPIDTLRYQPFSFDNILAELEALHHQDEEIERSENFCELDSSELQVEPLEVVQADVSEDVQLDSLQESGQDSRLKETSVREQEGNSKPEETEQVAGVLQSGLGKNELEAELNCLAVEEVHEPSIESNTDETTIDVANIPINACLAPTGKTNTGPSNDSPVEASEISGELVSEGSQVIACVKSAVRNIPPEGTDDSDRTLLVVEGTLASVETARQVESGASADVLPPVVQIDGSQYAQVQTTNPNQNFVCVADVESGDGEDFNGAPPVLVKSNEETDDTVLSVLKDNAVIELQTLVHSVDPESDRTKEKVSIPDVEDFRDIFSEEVKCPVCGEFTSISNIALNVHIDTCLKDVHQMENNQNKVQKFKAKQRKKRSMVEICAVAPKRTLDDSPYIDSTMNQPTSSVLHATPSPEPDPRTLTRSDSKIRRQPRTPFSRNQIESKRRRITVVESGKESEPDKESLPDKECVDVSMEEPKHEKRRLPDKERVIEESLKLKHPRKEVVDGSCDDAIKVPKNGATFHDVEHVGRKAAVKKGWITGSKCLSSSPKPAPVKIPSGELRRFPQQKENEVQNKDLEERSSELQNPGDKESSTREIDSDGQLEVPEPALKDQQEQNSVLAPFSTNTLNSPQDHLSLKAPKAIPRLNSPSCQRESPKAWWPPAAMVRNMISPPGTFGTVGELSSKEVTKTSLKSPRTALAGSISPESMFSKIRQSYIPSARGTKGIQRGTQRSPSASGSCDRSQVYAQQEHCTKDQTTFAADKSKLQADRTEPYGISSGQSSKVTHDRTVSISASQSVQIQDGIVQDGDQTHPGSSPLQHAVVLRAPDLPGSSPLPHAVVLRAHGISGLSPIPQVVVVRAPDQPSSSPLHQDVVVRAPDLAGSSLLPQAVVVRTQDLSGSSTLPQALVLEAQGPQSSSLLPQAVALKVHGLPDSSHLPQAVALPPEELRNSSFLPQAVLLQAQNLPTSSVLTPAVVLQAQEQPGSSAVLPGSSLVSQPLVLQAKDLQGSSMLSQSRVFQAKNLPGSFTSSKPVVPQEEVTALPDAIPRSSHSRESDTQDEGNLHHKGETKIPNGFLAEATKEIGHGGTQGIMSQNNLSAAENLQSKRESKKAGSMRHQLKSKVVRLRKLTSNPVVKETVVKARGKGKRSNAEVITEATGTHLSKQPKLKVDSCKTVTAVVNQRTSAGEEKDKEREASLLVESIPASRPVQQAFQDMVVRRIEGLIASEKCTEQSLKEIDAGNQKASESGGQKGDEAGLPSTVVVDREKQVQIHVEEVDLQTGGQRKDGQAQAKATVESMVQPLVWPLIPHRSPMKKKLPIKRATGPHVGQTKGSMGTSWRSASSERHTAVSSVGNTDKRFAPTPLRPRMNSLPVKERFSPRIAPMIDPCKSDLSPANGMPSHSVLSIGTAVQEAAAVQAIIPGVSINSHVSSLKTVVNISDSTGEARSSFGLPVLESDKRGASTLSTPAASERRNGRTPPVPQIVQMASVLEAEPVLNTPLPSKSSRLSFSTIQEMGPPQTAGNLTNLSSGSRNVLGVLSKGTCTSTSALAADAHCKTSPPERQSWITEKQVPAAGVETLTNNVSAASVSQNIFRPPAEMAGIIKLLEPGSVGGPPQAAQDGQKIAKPQKASKPPVDTEVSKLPGWMRAAITDHQPGSSGASLADVSSTCSAPSKMIASPPESSESSGDPGKAVLRLWGTDVVVPSSEEKAPEAHEGVLVKGLHAQGVERDTTVLAEKQTSPVKSASARLSLSQIPGGKEDLVSWPTCEASAQGRTQKSKATTNTASAVRTSKEGGLSLDASGKHPLAENYISRQETNRVAASIREDSRTVRMDKGPMASSAHGMQPLAPPEVIVIDDSAEPTREALTMEMLMKCGAIKYLPHQTIVNGKAASQLMEVDPLRLPPPIRLSHHELLAELKKIGLIPAPRSARPVQPMTPDPCLSVPSSSYSYGKQGASEVLPPWLLAEKKRKEAQLIKNLIVIDDDDSVDEVPTSTRATVSSTGTSALKEIRSGNTHKDSRQAPVRSSAALTTCTKTGHFEVTNTKRYVNTVSHGDVTKEGPSQEQRGVQGQFGTGLNGGACQTLAKNTASAIEHLMRDKNGGNMTTQREQGLKPSTGVQLGRKRDSLENEREVLHNRQSHADVQLEKNPNSRGSVMGIRADFPATAGGGLNRGISLLPASWMSGGNGCPKRGAAAQACKAAVERLKAQIILSKNIGTSDGSVKTGASAAMDFESHMNGQAQVNSSEKESVQGLEVVGVQSVPDGFRYSTLPSSSSTVVPNINSSKNSSLAGDALAQSLSWKYVRCLLTD